jgi:hypothetical protein
MYDTSKFYNCVTAEVGISSISELRRLMIPVRYLVHDDLPGKFTILTFFSIFSVVAKRYYYSEKTKGIRRLLFISNAGKCYLVRKIP